MEKKQTPTPAEEQDEVTQKDVEKLLEMVEKLAQNVESLERLIEAQGIVLDKHLNQGKSRSYTSRSYTKSLLSIPSDTEMGDEIKRKLLEERDRPFNSRDVVINKLIKPK